MAVVTRSTTWSDGQVLTASALNGEFNNLLNALAIVNADISGSAQIVESKILFSASGHGHTGGTDGKLVSTTLYRGFGFFVAGNASVTNDLSWNPTSPQAVTAVKLWAYCKTAPTGANLIARIYNITKAQIVATVTINASATSGSNASMTNATISQGDILRMDITQIGSSVVGADVTLVLETTQP